MVKIVTGWSNPGGSTTAFINLTNKLNETGIDTTLFGPHEWHLDKCKSDLISNCRPLATDKLIIHFLNLPKRPKVKKVILSCHEKNLYEVGEIPQFWDTAVFINKKHREYHSRYNGEYYIIPNLREDLNQTIKPNKKIAGIIGSIDRNKQTHLSISRAIKDGCSKIYLFGKITEPAYYEQYVEPLIKGPVEYYGYIEDKQKMYNMIDRVYLSSISECASLVKDECYTTKTEFFGNSAVEHNSEILDNDTIIKKWKGILEFDDRR